MINFHCPQRKKSIVELQCIKSHCSTNRALHFLAAALLISTGLRAHPLNHLHLSPQPCRHEPNSRPASTSTHPPSARVPDVSSTIFFGSRHLSDQKTRHAASASTTTIRRVPTPARLRAISSFLAAIPSAIVVWCATSVQHQAVEMGPRAPRANLKSSSPGRSRSSTTPSG